MWPGNYLVHGLTLTDVALNSRWLEGVPHGLLDHPLLTRYFMIIRRSTFLDVGGVDQFMSLEQGVWDWELCVKIGGVPATAP